MTTTAATDTKIQPADITAENYATFKVTFDSNPCGRCSGTGQTVWTHVHGGICFACNGGKVKLTRKGAAAKKAWDAGMDTLTQVNLADVVVGDTIQANRKWRRVTEIAENGGASIFKNADGTERRVACKAYTLTGTRYRYILCPENADGTPAQIRRHTPEAIAENVRQILRYSGATVTRKDS